MEIDLIIHYFAIFFFFGIERFSTISSARCSSDENPSIISVLTSTLVSSLILRLDGGSVVFVLTFATPDVLVVRLVPDDELAAGPVLICSSQLVQVKVGY